MKKEGFYGIHIQNSEYLAAYLLYWWASFAKGYIFELTIFRDLESAEIRFVAHDISSTQGRLSPSDLFVEELAGDIKNTTYFLYSSRSLPSNNDFYITRLYDEIKRKYRKIVIMKKLAWQEINGDVLPCPFFKAANFLPQTVQVDFSGEGLVIVDYNVWKQVSHKQRR